MVLVQRILLLLLAGLTPFCLFAQRPTTAGVQNKAKIYPQDVVERGRARFVQKCAFCHGRDAAGGEGGPNLTHSSIVADDVDGVQIGQVIRAGRGAMPRFNFTDAEIAELAAFLKTQAVKLESDEAQRRKIGLADLMTGDAKAGQAFFNGKGKCASCHSPRGDLADIRHRYGPVELERQMLYPEHARATATVHTKSGETVEGTLAYQDEFTLSITDDKGWRRSWSKSDIIYQVIDPVDAHRQLLPLYTNSDIHDLFAYLETL